MSATLKINITNYLFQKFNYKSETYLIKITHQKQYLVSIVVNLNFEKKKNNDSENRSFLGAHSK